MCGQDAAVLADNPVPQEGAFGLDERAVDVWVADLRDPAWPLQELEASLSSEEVARADRFHFAEDRRDFVTGRALLRWLLGRYTGESEIALVTNRWDKPLLRSSDGTEPLQFNVSHADGLIVLAFGQVETIGVDVESVGRQVDHLELAERFFAPGERECLVTLSAHQIPHGFFNCWTRKEAFVKAHGMGLSLPLDSFEVSLRPGDPAQLAWTADDRDDARTWELRTFTPNPGYVGALVGPRPLGLMNELRLDPATLALTRVQ